MATLKIKGSANQKFESDYFKINITIRAECKSSGKANEIGTKCTEQFLRLMRDNLGIEPDKFVLGSLSVSESYHNNSYVFIRKIYIEKPADILLTEQIRQLLEEMSDVSYDVDFKLSRRKEKEKVVLKSAIEDSRSKAEMIASAMGQKIIGAEKIEYEFPESEYDDSLVAIGSIKGKPIGVPESLTSKLKKPIIEISKNIYITWITE